MPPPPYISKSIQALVMKLGALLARHISLTDWVYDISIMKFHDVIMTSQSSHFEFRACSQTVDNDDFEKYMNLENLNKINKNCNIHNVT